MMKFKNTMAGRYESENGRFYIVYSSENKNYQIWDNNAPAGKRHIGTSSSLKNAKGSCEWFNEEV